MMWSKALRALAWFHRWSGIVLCLLFALWFASGAVLSFVPFPALADDARTQASERINLASLRVSPSAAMARAGGGQALRLVAAGGRPVYLITAADGHLIPIAGDTGERLAPFTDTQAGQIASAFARSPARSVAGPFAYDQWIVHQKFDPWRPFYRVSMADGAGTELYVSAVTGEVVQKTQASQRAWNWAGAISHWIYFTALRRSFFAWDQTVWWVSLVGVTTAVAGAWLGVYRTLKRLKGRRPNWSPFRGWMRWHHGLGLGVAVFVLTWIVSGWLSMDHGRLFSRGAPPAGAEARYHGEPLITALSAVGPSDLSALGSPGQVTFNVVGRRPLAAAEGDDGGPRVLMLDAADQPAKASTPTDLMANAAAAAWPLESRDPLGPKAQDALYRVAESMPERAIRFQLIRPSGASIYIDPVTGRPLTLVDRSRQAYAWVYFALHTFKFPWLIDRPILRHILELIPLLAGLGFSLTGLVIAVKRLRATAS